MNLSLGGAFVQTKHVYKPGTVLSVEFTDKDSKASLKAVVIWAKVVPAQLSHLFPCGMGLRFIDPDMKWKEFYMNWCGESVELACAK